MNKKIISCMLATLITSATLTTSVQAKELIKKNTSNNVNAVEHIMRISHPGGPPVNPNNEVYRIRRHFNHSASLTAIEVGLDAITTKWGWAGNVLKGLATRYIMNELRKTQTDIYVETILYRDRGADGKMYDSVYVINYSDPSYRNVISSQMFTRRTYNQ